MDGIVGKEGILWMESQSQLHRHGVEGKGMDLAEVWWNGVDEENETLHESSFSFTTFLFTKALRV